MKYQCPDCSKKFDSLEAMEQHRKDKHTAAEKPKRKMNMKRIGIAAAIIIIIIGIGLFFVLSPSPTYTIQRERTNFAGPENATVTVIEFSDFECPFCGKAAPTVKQVKEQYGDRIRFVYKHFPLPSHSTAPKAAEAAECAGDQGKFWEMHDKMFANQKALFPNSLKGYAKDIGLNTTAFNNCLDSGIMASRVQSDQQEGNTFGVKATPTFFINNRKIEGAQPLSAFQSAIESELAKG